MENSTIKIENISKRFGEVAALKNIKLEIKKGELFGLIGPDGAGKTTLFKILVTLLKPDTGIAVLNDFDVTKKIVEVRDIIGYMPGKFSLYQDLSIKENLTFFATAFGTTLEENYDLIKDIYTQIEPFKDRKAGDLSGGMKQKLALCCALIHKPKILILDEPTTGVDAVSRKEFWQMLNTIKNQGITIFVATPYMDEASLCERIALIQNGEIMSIDSPKNIAESFPLDLYKIKSSNKYNLINSLRKWEKSNYCYAFGEYIHWASMDNFINEKSIENYLLENNISEVVVSKTSPTVEDTFIYLMQKTN
jgi:ABC-2 type transport system ATP-binding protein